MSLEIGKSIHNGKYRIEKYLGGGGFARTYLAIHTTLNRKVAIETPNQDVKNHTIYHKYVKRFIKEASILAEVAECHPNIVQINDLFEENGDPYLVLQFIPGTNLFNWVKNKGKLAEKEAFTYIHQIGSALVEVHRREILHLDVTPSNIMINSNSGNPKAVLIDFGIAANILSRPSTLSRSFGTKAFAPYELLRKAARHPTVDVYCLAASLYYAVTGKMPTESLARKWEEEELIPPQQYVSNLSESCCDAIMRGMELEAKDRPQTMQEWLNYLIPNSSDYHIELKSDVGVDYSNLEKLLQAQNWREADKETRRLMLKVANREQQGWLDYEQINNFPCADLRTIDQLWVKYSIWTLWL